MKAKTPKETGRGKKKLSQGVGQFSKNTITSYRKLDKHESRIPEYREKVDSHNAEHPNDVLTFTATGVSVEGTPGVEEWQTAMQFVQRAGGAVMWWLGDLLVHGEANYEELEEVGDSMYEYGTLRNAKYVAENVPLSSRNDKLSFKHHFAVAPIPKRDQKRWLKKAEKDGWSVATLRKELADQRSRKLLGDNPLPDGRYHVLYADPPWPRSPRSTRPRMSGIRLRLSAGTPRPQVNRWNCRTRVPRSSCVPSVGRGICWG